jgi:hypothetical protein
MSSPSTSTFQNITTINIDKIHLVPSLRVLTAIRQLTVYLAYTCCDTISISNTISKCLLREQKATRYMISRQCPRFFTYYETTCTTSIDKSERLYKSQPNEYVIISTLLRLLFAKLLHLIPTAISWFDFPRRTSRVAILFRP